MFQKCMFSNGANNLFRLLGLFFVDRSENERMEEAVLSVGIDLGTTTMQLVISRLLINNVASPFTIPRVEITEKKIIYRSAIEFTPIMKNNLISIQGVKLFLDREYRKAGIAACDIKLGAVIITGETARKDNGNAVLHALSEYAGDFVVATVGADLESVIAGKGAGAQEFSQKNNSEVVNFDIGGGTTNIAVFNQGELAATSCLDIGGRLIRVAEKSRQIIYIAPKVQKIIDEAGISLKLGQIVSEHDLQPLVEIFVECLENAVGVGEKNPFFKWLVTNQPLGDYKLASSSITFSGGVADCLRQDFSDPFKFGDIGILLGREIRKSQLASAERLISSKETIRATVVGAGSHTTQISGSTITYGEGVVPLKNLPVLKLTNVEEEFNWETLGNTVQNKLKWYALENELGVVALGLQGKKNPTFAEITVTAKGIFTGFREQIVANLPLVIVIAEDNAKALGQALQILLPPNYPLICVDSVHVENGDYIDIGSPLANAGVLPLVVKTLIFE